MLQLQVDVSLNAQVFTEPFFRALFPFYLYTTPSIDWYSPGASNQTGGGRILVVARNIMWRAGNVWCRFGDVDTFDVPAQSVNEPRAYCYTSCNFTWCELLASLQSLLTIGFHVSARFLNIRMAKSTSASR